MAKDGHNPLARLVCLGDSHTQGDGWHSLCSPLPGPPEPMPPHVGKSKLRWLNAECLLSIRHCRGNYPQLQQGLLVAEYDVTQFREPVILMPLNELARVDLARESWRGTPRAHSRSLWGLCHTHTTSVRDKDALAEYAGRDRK